MNHVFSLHRETFDLRTAVTCGQVFRWSEPTPGLLQGIDGNHWFLAQETDSGWTIKSNASEEDFLHFAGLDSDDTAIRAEISSAVPELSQLMTRHRSLRLLRPSSWVEACFSFLCSSNNHIARIGQMVNHLASYGSAIPDCPFHGVQFPTIEVLAQLQESELRAAKFGYRAKTIPLVARAMSIQLTPPAGQTLEPWLSTLPGIGSKLAACIAIYAFHDGSAVPMDVHMKRAFVHFGLAESMAEGHLREGVTRFKEALGSRAAYAQLLMFHDQRMRSVR